MAVNRFYNPSLPQYTSQFVEDKTPWDQMLALEQTKLERTDKAQQMAGQVDALSSALTAGLRTNDLAEEVKGRYKGALNEWYKKYDGNYANSQAIRNLTKLNAEFSGDRDVQLVAKDYQDSEYYKKIKMQQQAGQEDPNYHPVNGYSQFKSGDEYVGYDPLMDVRDYMTKMYGNIKTTQGSNTAYKEIAKQLDGKQVLDENDEPIVFQGYETTNYEKRDATELGRATTNEAQNIISQRGPMAKVLANRLGVNVNDLTVDQVQGELKRYEKENEIVNSQSSFHAIGEGRSAGAKPKDIPIGAGLSGPGSVEKIIPPANDLGTVEGSKTELGLIAKHSVKNLKEWMSTNRNQEYYNAVKNDPSKLLEPESYNILDPPSEKSKLKWDFGTASLGEIGAPNTLIEQKIMDSPIEAKQMFDEYFANEESKGLSYIEKNKLRSQKHAFEKTYKSVLKNFNIDEKPFENDQEFTKAIIAYASKYGNSVEGPLKMNVLNLTQEEVQKNPSLIVELKLNKIAYGKEISEKGVTPVIEIIPNSIELTKVLVNSTIGSNGVLEKDGGATSLFLGANVFRKNPDKERDRLLEKENRQELFKAGTSVNTQGMLSPETSQYGPGVFSLMIGDEEFYMEGPKEIVEANRFIYNARSYGRPNNMRVGDFFFIRGNNLNKQTGELDFIVGDRWNNIDGKMSPEPTDVWMNVTYNSKIKDMELRGYMKNPNIKDKSIGEPYSESNKNGYLSIPLGVGLTQSPQNETLERAAQLIYNEVGNRKNQ